VLEAVDCAQVALTARPAAPQLAIRVSSGDGSALGEPQPKSNLATARELMEAIGGGMVIVHEGELWEIRFTCPQGRRRCVLVVDDNQDVVDLFRRYLIGSPWTVRGARSASEARAVVLRSPPDAVILDVMMPHEDGWEFLDWLTGSAVGHDLPVLICSVLPEKTLALEMGAVAYLPKPVTQEMVLRALQQLV
jgi:CheY-like chemotaxis protein